MASICAIIWASAKWRIEIASWVEKSRPRLIDEFAGQHLALILDCGVAGVPAVPDVGADVAKEMICPEFAIFSDIGGRPATELKAGDPAVAAPSQGVA